MAKDKKHQVSKLTCPFIPKLSNPLRQACPATESDLEQPCMIDLNFRWARHYPHATSMRFWSPLAGNRGLHSAISPSYHPFGDDPA